MSGVCTQAHEGINMPPTSAQAGTCQPCLPSHISSRDRSQIALPRWPGAAHWVSRRRCRSDHRISAVASEPGLQSGVEHCPSGSSMPTGPARGLLGRRAECRVLDQLLERVRGSQSQVLVLRGEAGVGKTALVDYLVERGSGCRVVRVAGVESEMELAFAGV